MGDTPQIPKYKAPSGAPGFMKTPGITTDQGSAIAEFAPGSRQILNAGGFAGAFDVNSPQNQAVLSQIASYGMSDKDFAQRNPQMVQARDQYQNYLNQLLGPQTATSMNQGNYMMGQGNTLMGTGQRSIASGENMQNYGTNIVNSGMGVTQQGMGVAGQGQNFLTPAARLAAAAQAAGQPDIAMGQRLINGQMPIDPMVQQELMRSGLSSAAGSLGGAAALGGTAGQAAVGRQLGVGAQNYINSQRQMGMALQQAGGGLTSALAGSAGTLAGAGSGVINAGSGLVNAGSGLINAGSGVYGAGTGAIGTGANVMGTGANIATAGQGVIDSATRNANQGFGLASSLFQPRTFGLSGADAANISLANYTGQNNMNQFIYGTKVQGAQQNTQIAGANANAQAQASGQMIQGGIGVGTAVATTAATIAAMSCWLAREAFGDGSPDFIRFRFWLLNCGPRLLRSLYQRYAKRVASFVSTRRFLKSLTATALRYISRDVPCARLCATT